MANTPANRKKRRKRRPVLRFFKVLLLLLMIAVLCTGGYAFSRIYPEFEKIRENAVKLMSPQARKAAVAAGRAVDVTADDFEG